MECEKYSSKLPDNMEDFINIIPVSMLVLFLNVNVTIIQVSSNM